MEDYDEDLSENPWYLAFIQNHKKLFSEIAGERWIICVPRSGSWKGGKEAPKTYSGSYFQSHCMKYDGEEITQQKKEGDTLSPPKHVDKYQTHNGKTLLVEGSRVTCGSGFEEAATSFDSRSGHLDLPPSGLNHSAKILFEETYFNANDQSYKMLCISRPLELHLSLFQDTAHGDEDSPSDEFGFTDKLRSSQQLWGRASKPEKLKKNVDTKISAFIKSHGSGKPATEQTLHDVNNAESLEMDEITGVDACVAAVNILYNTCLQIVIKDGKIKKDTETNPLDNTKSALESYVLREVHGSVFRQVSSAVSTQEAAFNKMICNLFDAQPRELQIEEKYWLSLPRAKRHLSRINKCCTPQEKLSCLQQTVYCITAKQGLPDNAALGSDDLLPILIYLIIKSNIPNWITNLMYLQHFQIVQQANEQQSFLITTMEAAVEHIKFAGRSILAETISKSEEKEPSLVQQYFENAVKGDTAAVKEMLSKSASERKECEQTKCHPLCTCEKCAILKRRSASKAESSVTVYTKNDKGQTALHIAALSGHHEVVDVLVELGAELNAIDYHGSTPLHCATLSGSQSVVFLLLHHGANPNATDNNSNTPLHLCSQRGHEACAKAILYFDPRSPVASVDMENDEGDRPLHVASKWGYVGIVAALLECGANPRATNRRRQSSVDVSLNDKVSLTIRTAAADVIKIVRSLKHLQMQPLQEIEYSPKKTEEDRTRDRARTPKELEETIDSVYVAKQVEKMLRAVNDNDVNMVKFLCGWQTSEEDENTKLNEPPCHPLCQCTKCHPLSHEHVLHANSANQEKFSGLMLAAKNGYLEMVDLFLEQGANVNCRTKKHGYSPLHLACESGNVEIIRMILSQDGVNPDIRDVNGSTPLYSCAISNNPECATALLKGNASLNIRNRNGDTPLHVAVKWKSEEVVKILLDNEALAYYRNNDGLTPEDLAEKDSTINSLLMTALTPIETVSPTTISGLGVSPHSPYSESLDQSENSTTNAELNSASDTQRTDSRSIEDEAIANELYSRFKDPAPPTPPISTHGSTSADELLPGEVVTENLAFDENDGTGEVFSRPHIAGKDPSAKSISSDIFRDLLKDEPLSQRNLQSSRAEGTSVSVTEGEKDLQHEVLAESLKDHDFDLQTKASVQPDVGDVAELTGDSYFEMG